MAAQQARLGFDSYDNDLTVEFMSDPMSTTSWPYRLAQVSSIEDLPIAYAYWITGPYTRTLQVPYYLDVGMADYISVTGDHPYKSEWLRYCAKNGFQPQLYLMGDCNDSIIHILEDVDDVKAIQRVRWDFGTYFSEDYYDKPGSGLATSFVWYLIEKYGFETMFDYVYETGNEPIVLDLPAEQEAWIAYLEDTYGSYPKYSQIPMEITVDCQDPDCTDASHHHTGQVCMDLSCTDATHDHSARDCTDTNCTDPYHDHSAGDCTDTSCPDLTHDHHHHEH